MKGKKLTKKNRLTRILAILVAVLMTAFVSIPAFAAGYTGVEGPTVQFTKYLVVRKGETNPEVEFTFEVSVPGSKVDGTSSTTGVIPGIGLEDPSNPLVTVGSASFSRGEASNDADESSDGVDRTIPAVDAFVNSDGYTYATEEVTVDFSGVTFTEPGVYRYYITESGSSDASFGYDSVSVRTIDIYIQDDGNGNLQVAGQVMYKGEISESPKKAATGSTTAVPNGAEPDGAEKSNKFTNTYPTNKLTIKNTVDGNQGSKDKYFKFKIKAASNDIVATNHYTIDGLDKNPTGNSATIYTDLRNNNVEYLTGAQLTEGYEVYLQHDDVVVLYGLPIGSDYTITEVEEGTTHDGYITSWSIARDSAPTIPIASSSDENKYEATERATPLRAGYYPANTTVTFTNYKNGVIPTGIIVSVAGLLVVGGIAIIGFVFFGTRSKKRYEEN